MRAVLCRQYYQKQTIGTLTVYDEDSGAELFKCRTIELPDLNNQRRISCIPEGFYDVDPHVSPRFGKCYWVKDVPKRSEILFHAANFVGSSNPRTGKADLLGCIGVGSKIGDITGDGIPELLDSKNTLNKLLEVAPDGFVLEVTQ